MDTQERTLTLSTFSEVSGVNLMQPCYKRGTENMLIIYQHMLVFNILFQCSYILVI